MSKVPHTRIFDELVPKFGLVGAAVYGVVWRYCQMRDKACHATHETLANELGIGQSTVRQYIDELRDKQYIAVIFDKANSPNWMILGENQVSGDNTSKQAGASRKHLGARRKHLPKGEKVPADSTEETKDLKKPVKKPKKATPSRKRKRTPFWNDDLRVLADHFSEVSNIAIPKLEGRAFAAVTRSWKMPLSQMFELVGSVTETKHLIALTIQEMRADKLTIFAPRSIWKNAVSIHARGPTNGPEPAGAAGIREYLAKGER